MSVLSPMPHPVDPSALVDLPHDVICPGAKNLFPSDGLRYLRLVFTAYWNGAAPSTEVFYLTMHRFHLSLTGIAAIEKEVLSVMQTQDASNPPISVTYVTYSGIELTDDDVSNLDWRVISG